MSIFSSVPITKLSRSTFNLDHENKLSFNFGGLYPILCQTVLPGDKMSLGIQSFVRTVPLLSPVMHRNDIKIDSFFVPMRLIWDKSEEFLQCSDPTLHMPTVGFSTAWDNHEYDYSSQWNFFQGVGSLADYLGFASCDYSTCINDAFGKMSDRVLNALPFRTYQLIYDYYYRNKTLEPSILDDPYYDIKSSQDLKFSTGTDPNTKHFAIKLRSWRRDVFTSALPDPQKGNPVLMPTGDIVSDGAFHFDYDGSSSHESKQLLYDTNSAKYTRDANSGTNPSGVGGQIYSKGLKIDSPTIEDFRYAEVLEEYEEALARSGAGNTGTFKEWLLAIWRTLSPDARLDRPEYLGGYRGPIQISEVPQTSAATSTSAQGTLAGKGLSVGGQLLFKNKHFKEAGYLMVIMSVVPKSAYFQGDPRQFLYSNPYDFPNPYFANLGEQEVYTQEVCAAKSIYQSDQQKTFGYQVRNYEMKQIPDQIHGDLRSSLLYWHEGRIFDDDPDSATTVNLNSNFVKMNPLEVSRIFPSSETSNKLIGEFFFNFRAKRSLPYYGVPRVGHTK